MALIYISKLQGKQGTARNPTYLAKLFIDYPGHVVKNADLGADNTARLHPRPQAPQALVAHF